MNAGVRRLMKGEAGLYRAVRLESLKESPEAFATTYESALARDADSWRAQADGSAEGRDRATFVAITGRPVGVGALYRDQDGSAAGELIQVWVAPECRGGPVAAELLEAIFEWAAANGFETIRAEVTAGNARALRFYEKHGFLRAEEPAAAGESAHRLVKRVGPGR
jgi:ribosomal protein S18 acetylase RimI-like enzyme